LFLVLVVLDYFDKVDYAAGLVSPNLTLGIRFIWNKDYIIDFFMVNKTTASEWVLVQVSWESGHGFPGTKTKVFE